MKWKSTFFYSGNNLIENNGIKLLCKCKNSKIKVHKRNSFNGFAKESHQGILVKT